MKGTTILQSGVNFIPMTIGILIFAMAGGISLSKFGAYRSIHATMFVLSSLAFGLFTLLDQGTPKVTWAIFKIISASLGMSDSTVLPAILASLPDTDVASANAAFPLSRCLGLCQGHTSVDYLQRWIPEGFASCHIYRPTDPSRGRRSILFC